MDILKNIKEELPKAITDASFEGANIVLYTDDKDFFKNGESKVKEVVDKIKKRIELRADQSILLSESEAEKTIRALIPEEAEITNIIFDVQRSIVIIEAKKPGMVIGKQGSVLADIKKSTFWLPTVQRSPSIPSKITEKIRSVLYANNNYRRKFLNDIGKKIYNEWNPEKMDMWVRLTYLGSGRQVGRSCLLLHTPNSKILLDCGINPAILDGAERFPYLNVSEIGDLSSIDAIILSHAHLDHCLPAHFPVLTEEGYKKIDEIKVGENIISMDWKSGKYIKSKCTEKTRTTGHKKIFAIKTPYSKIESSPNHRFFTFENMQLKELEASELKQGMLLPSNILNKSFSISKNMTLDKNIEYDKRRKDNVILSVELTPKLSEFIGYYMGDGHKSSEFSLRLTDASTQILEHHKNRIKELFNFDAKIRHHSDKTKNAHILEINNVKIIRFLEKNFPEMMLKTKEIRIPEKIINASAEIQRAFIRGFADADGSFTKSVKITSFSSKMLDNLQHILSLQEIPSSIDKDNTLHIDSRFGIAKFYEKIGFSLNYKQEKLKEKVDSFPSLDFIKQDLLPITPKDLRKILKETGMFGRIHNSPKLSKLLPMSLLDLFRRKEGYATRKTILHIKNLLENRIAELQNAKDNSQYYALRQLLSLTRQEISISTGLKVSQIQQIEENRISEQFAVKIVPILAGFMQEKLSIIISQTINNLNMLQNLLSLNILWEKITSVVEKDNPYPYLVDIEVENHNFIAGNIIVHNSGVIPYLYKMGYKGPVYMTAPTRDIASLLALDYVGVAYKQATTPLYRAEDIKEMVRHSICLDYGEVTDITPDIRITLYNAGHVLGSAQVHINIGNGLHNLVYTGDTKYAKTRLLDPAVNHFPRVETLTLESTYGAKEDILPPRRETEQRFIEIVKETIAKKGKVLFPELGLGHAQETMLRVEEAIRTGELPSIPVIIDGMIWDINAIHTAYPDFLSSTVRNQIFQDNNPFLSDIFKRIGSPTERKEVIEGGPCIIIATSGMLVGGASVEYFKHLADNPNNVIVFSCFQAQGSLGRQVKEGNKQVYLGKDYGNEKIDVKMRVETLYGLSAHSGRNELMQYVSRMIPKPKRISINHGEISKSLDLASSLYKMNRVETVVPRNLETIRLK
ncbi:MAG: LAGLIDADG family homing endonuclease [archaeon]|nr:LAGLIDADG family homing endonuclease [archaeon]